MPLKEGNQWIYQTHFIYSAGTEKYRLNDTTTLLGDTIIANQQYFIESVSFYGDSKVRLISIDGPSIKTYPEGEVLFATDTAFTYRNFTTGGSPDTLLITDYRLNGKKIISVPAGQYESLEYEGEVQVQYKPVTVFNRSYFSSGLGLVLKQYPLVSGNGCRIEQRLIEFHL